jgi:phosphoribosylanthranilate isomerase
VTKIKICGNTRATDVTVALELGVDLVGFIFTRSKRQITIGEGEVLAIQVPDQIGRVGVFIDEPTSLIAEAVERCRLSAVQIYRPVSPADRALGVSLLPAFRVGNGDAIREATFDPTDHPLLDTWASDTAGGGTGRPWNWEEASALARQQPIIVSGGLTAENVGEAIRRLKPWGVDVCSGVEAEPGRKDPAKLRAFVEAVRAVHLQ